MINTMGMLTTRPMVTAGDSDSFASLLELPPPLGAWIAWRLGAIKLSQFGEWW
jgi:hypothetical protein